MSRLGDAKDRALATFGQPVETGDDHGNDAHPASGAQQAANAPERKPERLQVVPNEPDDDDPNRWPRIEGYAEQDDTASGHGGDGGRSGDDEPHELEDGPDESLWTMTPWLAQIRTAAHARVMPADAVLGCVLARVAATIPPSVTLPAIVGTPAGLNTFCVIVGQPGGGKTASRGIAAELFPYKPDDRHLPDLLPSSGQGLVEAFLGDVEEPDDTGKPVKRKRQVYDSALAMLDEGGILGELRTQKGNVVFDTLRSMWSGSTAGQHNATSDRTRVLEGGRYRLAMIVLIQPQYADAILGDVDGGLPQRCAWFSATDPTIPDDAPVWPGRLDWKPELDAKPHRDHIHVADTIAAGIRRRHLARQRGEAVDDYDGHADLVKLKLAALVAALEGRPYEIGEHDWQIAEKIHERSNATRRRVERSIAHQAAMDEQGRNAAAGRRKVAEAEHVEQRAREKAVRAVARKARRAGGPVTRRDMTQAIAGRDRRHVELEDVLAEAERREHIAPDPSGEDRWIVGRQPVS